MSAFSRYRSLVRFVGAFLLAFWCCGCLVIPIHHSKNMRSLSTEAPPKQVDLSFVKVGETSRDQVLQRLGWIDTGLHEQNFFLGRWAENSWGIAWAAGSYYTATGGYNQVWKAHNVVIDFDDQAMVSGIATFPDKELLATLAARLSPASERTLDLSVPITIPILYTRDLGYESHAGNFLLSQEELEFRESPNGNKKQKYNFKTPPGNVTRVTMGSSDPAQPEQVCAVLHFRQKTAVGKQMTIYTKAADTALLLRYFAQYGSLTQINRN